MRSLRARLPFFPFPTFTFRIWLTGLIVAVCLLLALSVFAFRGSRWMIPLAFLFGTLMLFNPSADGHIGGSIYMGRLMPGVYSAPLLLAGSIYLLAAARPSADGHGRPRRKVLSRDDPHYPSPCGRIRRPGARTI